MLEGYQGQLMVVNEAMIFMKPSVKSKFRYFRKNSTHWKGQVSNKNYKFGMTAYEISSGVINSLIGFVTGCPASDVRVN